MFPHLIGMKEINHLTSEDMGAIIGTSRQTYEYKARCGSFDPSECKALCKRFGKTFEYLFATADEIEEIDAASAYLLGCGILPTKENADAGIADEGDHANAGDADVKQEAG